MSLFTTLFRSAPEFNNLVQNISDARCSPTIYGGLNGGIAADLIWHGGNVVGDTALAAGILLGASAVAAFLRHLCVARTGSNASVAIHTLYSAAIPLKPEK